MRVLVVGGAGSIGSNFIPHTPTIWPDVNVTVPDALACAANPASLEGADCEIIRGDVRGAELIDRLVPRFDVVVHFAAESHNDNSLADANPFVTTNVLDTVNLAEACTTHEVRLHHISTDEVFGDPALDDPARFTTATAYRSFSPYSASEASADHFVRAWMRNFGLAVMISNCSNNYGSRQHSEKLIPRQICGLLRGCSPHVYDTGENVRDWIHVDDHNDTVRAVLDAGGMGETYLTGVNDEHSNLDMAGDILEGFGRVRSDFVHVTDRPGHDCRYAIDPVSIRTPDWQPRYQDFSSGPVETIDWYRANKPWWAAAYDVAEANYAEREQELQL